MFRIDIIVALRTMLKYKGYTAINIFGLAIIIAFATVSFQSVKAALADPVKNLKSE